MLTMGNPQPSPKSIYIMLNLDAVQRLDVGGLSFIKKESLRYSPAPCESLGNNRKGIDGRAPPGVLLRFCS
jgi:hypothetical protein